MPPPPGSGDGGTKKKKKKKGRAPAHQNTFAFRHNPKSKKTEKILSSPNVGVCTRCRDKIEWRKKYRKYKPLTQPAKCNLCSQRNITAAYHTICGTCAVSEKAVGVMERKRLGGGVVTKTVSASAKCEMEHPVREDCDASLTMESPESIGAKCSRNRHQRVCGVCTSEWATSEFSNVSPEDMDIVEKINELEDAIESGLHVGDGHKMTLREVRGAEREVEKYREELKERRQTKTMHMPVSRDGDEVEAGEDEDDDDEDELSEDEVDEEGVDDGDLSDDDDNRGRVGQKFHKNNEANDPFLLATGGKALVGEDYRQMLLANQWKSSSKNY